MQRDPALDLTSSSGGMSTGTSMGTGAAMVRIQPEDRRPSLSAIFHGGTSEMRDWEVREGIDLRECGLGEVVGTHLREVATKPECFQGARPLLLLHSDAEVLYCTGCSVAEQDQLMSSYLKVKKSALDLAEALKEESVPILRIIGENHVFSAYDVDPDMHLVFYAPNSSPEDDTDSPGGDMVKRDLRVQEIIQNLEGVLDELMSSDDSSY